VIRYVALLAAASPIAAQAEPINLKCELNDRGTIVPMEVALDEQAASASYYWPKTDTSAKDPANFLPAKVLFSSFTIDRTTLAITREPILDIPAISGQCQVLKLERAF
jgi:hypothetical protein